MVRARSARAYDLFAEGLTRTEYAHPGIVRRDARCGCEVFDRNTIDVELPQRLGVVFLQRACELADTATNRAAHLDVRLGTILNFPTESGELAIRRRPPALVIDYGVAQDSIEPWDDGFLGPERIELRHAAHERILENVFSDGPAPHALLQEREKLAVVSNEHARHIAQGVCRNIQWFYVRCHNRLPAHRANTRFFHPLTQASTEHYTPSDNAAARRPDCDPGAPSGCKGPVPLPSLPRPLAWQSRRSSPSSCPPTAPRDGGRCLRAVGEELPCWL